MCTITVIVDSGRKFPGTKDLWNEMFPGTGTFALGHENTGE